MVLINYTPNRTLLGLLNILVGHRLTFRAHTIRSIHANLKLVTLPAKDVVGVLPVARAVAVAEDKGLRAVGGPKVLIVKGRSVPDNFVHELRDADGMRGGAVTSEIEEGGWAVRGVCFTVISISSSNIY
jgi:hypothetical protein